MEVEPNANQKKQADGKEKNYEALMTELTQVMKTMENSESTLEEQLKGYEMGMQLCSELETLLKAAEERIMIINRAGEEERFE